MRDKVISLRVNSELLGKVNDVISSRTISFTGRGGRNYYTYRDGSGYAYDKFTVADLLEDAMKKYVAEAEAQAEGAK